MQESYTVSFDACSELACCRHIDLFFHTEIPAVGSISVFACTQLVAAAEEATPGQELELRGEIKAVFKSEISLCVLRAL